MCTKEAHETTGPARAANVGHTWVERCAYMEAGQGRIEEFVKMMPHRIDSPVVIALDRSAERAEARTTLREYYVRKKNGELQKALHGVGYASQIPKGPKAKLVELLIACVPDEPFALMEFVVPFGKDYVRSVQRLLEAGSEARFAWKYLYRRDRLIQSAPPVVLLFRCRHELINIIPEDVRPTLGLLTAEDWDRLALLGEQYDEAIGHLRLLCDLRGALTWEEAYASCVAEVDHVPSALASVVTNEDHPRMRDAGFVLRTIGDVVYLVHARLAKAAEEQMHLQPAQYLERYVREAEKYEPGALTDALKDAGSVTDLMLRTDGATELLTYLDDHADTMFTVYLRDCVKDEVGDALADIVGQTQWGGGTKTLADRLEEAEYFLSEEEREQVGMLEQALIVQVPRWDLNGQTDEAVFGGPRPEAAKQEPRKTEEKTRETEEEPQETEEGSTSDDEGRNSHYARLRAAMRREREFMREDGNLWPTNDDGEYDHEAAYAAVNALLKEFAQALVGAGISEAAAERHADNTYYFLRYLVDYECVTPKGGVGLNYVNEYLGDHFLRKMTWSTPETVRETAASLSRFYRFMCDTGRISEEKLDAFLKTVEDWLPDWCDRCERLHNMSWSDLLTGWGAF